MKTTEKDSGNEEVRKLPENKMKTTEKDSGNEVVRKLPEKKMKTTEKDSENEEVRNEDKKLKYKNIEFSDYSDDDNEETERREIYNMPELMNDSIDTLEPHKLISSFCHNRFIYAMRRCFDRDIVSIMSIQLFHEFLLAYPDSKRAWKKARNSL